MGVAGVGPAVTRRYWSAVIPAPGERATLDPAASHHLLVVCRHPRGDVVVLFDGASRQARCRLVDVVRGRAVLEGLAEPAPPSLPSPLVVLLLARVKAGPFETALRMAAELGVHRIRPLTTARTVVTPGRDDRWERLLVAAAGQCGRDDVPALDPPLSLAEALASELPGDRLLMAPGAPVAPRPHGDRALLVGPEGGFTDEEQEAAQAAGFRAAGLGSWTLRTDTAVAASLALYGPGPGHPGGAGLSPR